MMMKIDFSKNIGANKEKIFKKISQLPNLSKSKIFF